MGKRIVFMGTPEFAAFMLKQLLQSKHEIAAVVTVADKPAGRGQQTKESAVKKIAQQANLLILQPISLKDPEFIQSLQAIEADLFIVVAFRMLPAVVWKIPKLGTINLHASLLPQLRGAAPINWGIINDVQTTGLTTFLINEEIDCGAILMQKTMSIPKGYTAGKLHDEMLAPGAQLLIQTIDSINSLQAINQVDIPSTSLLAAPKLTKLNTKINFRQRGNRIVSFVNGLNPYPSAYCILINKSNQKQIVFKIHEGFFIESSDSNRTLHQNNQGLLFPCLDGFFCATQIQPEGKRSMTHKEYMAGNNIAEYELVD